LLFFFAFSFWNNSSLQNAKETMGVGWLWYLRVEKKTSKERRK
jgi:hypothetical protein